MDLLPSLGLCPFEDSWSLSLQVESDVAEELGSVCVVQMCLQASALQRRGKGQRPPALEIVCSHSYFQCACPLPFSTHPEGFCRFRGWEDPRYAEHAAVLWTVVRVELPGCF